MQGKTKAVISIFFLLIAVFSGGSAYYYHLQYKKEQELKAAELSAQKTKDDSITASRKEFGALLDAMIDELKAHARTYRKQRIVLKEAIHPLNFETPERAQESYTVFTKEIVPLLRKSADSTIALFQTYDAKAKTLFPNMPEEIKAELQTDWETMHKKQLEDHIAFFTKEEDVIASYLDLIKFYAKNADTYTIDEAGEHLVFDNEDDQRQEQKLLDAINALKQ